MHSTVTIMASQLPQRAGGPTPTTIPAGALVNSPVAPLISIATAKEIAGGETYIDYAQTKDYIVDLWLPILAEIILFGIFMGGSKNPVAAGGPENVNPADGLAGYAVIQGGPVHAKYAGGPTDGVPAVGLGAQGVQLSLYSRRTPNAYFASLAQTSCASSGSNSTGELERFWNLSRLTAELFYFRS
ncbi:hypothetical protein K432DRAFT_441531 [Lepidopterella palustris CBS 459.81]|uniref:Uncharacterized protein n=1 Tax=Lepidopterella palustris CBS 459.81 TaxID=1314670 RepID=A0A8E2EEH0_9PEZI|nr:hypothetical protein K432DRAFT_441531 [Lepidopterella palustris CBS 459.81]